jgi:transposase
MNKHRYQAKKLQQVDWGKLAEVAGTRRLVLGVDVAKEDFYAALLVSAQEVLTTITWRHPQETRVLEECLQALGAVRIEVAMEPSGTYGDSLREVLRALGCRVYLVSPKRVHDVAEVYDGVPSLHDAKAAYLIGRLHLEGASRVWREDCAERRDRQALVAELDLHHSEQRRNLNRLEALLSRHWPELGRVTELNRAGVLQLLATYGSPQAVRAEAAAAEALLYRVGRGLADAQSIAAILDSAEHTLGVVCTPGERHLLQVLAEAVLRTRQALREVERRIAQWVQRDPPLQSLADTLGKTTALVLDTALGSPLDYPNPHAYLKAMGLNLKERSSGQHQGRLKITKRGPGRARHYLFLSALRFVQRDPVIRAWYLSKLRRDGQISRCNALVAVMRKLALALWHVARGNPFDSRKLFDLNNLTLAA